MSEIPTEINAAPDSETGDTYYKWKSKYGGMDVHELRHLRQLETENRRLKQMYAELSLDHKILKDIISKKL